MGRKKSNKFLSVFKIFFKSIKTYFLYLDKTAKYLLLPVLGQVIGVILIFMATYYFNNNIDKLVKIAFFSQNKEHLLLGLILVILPFLALILHSFYKYIIAFSSLNLFFYTLTPKKVVKTVDFKSNDKVIERKLFQYILLMLFISVLCLFPPLWIVLCLSFQVFALENDANCFNSISRSIKLTLENLFPTVIMLTLIFLVSYQFLPALFVWALDKIHVTDFMVTKLEVFLQMLPYNEWNNILSIVNQHIDSVTVAKAVTEFIITFIIVGFTLPFRCCCFTELYRLFDNEQIKEYSRESEEIIKRATSKKRKN